MEYSYRCTSCKRLFATGQRSDNLTCDYCQGPAVRQYAFTVGTGLREHWNNAVGEYVSNRRQLDDAFKRQSEAASVRTGIEHEFVAVDPSDMRDAKAHGVDENTLEHTRKVHHDNPELLRP